MQRICLGILVLAIGCGDDDGGTDSAVDAPTVDTNGADVAVDTPTGGESFTFTAIDIGEDDAPIADVRVVAVLPGGTQVETTSDASGDFTIDGVDFALGTLGISGWKDGYTVGGALALDAAGIAALRNSEIRMAQLDNTPEFITVSGTVTGLGPDDLLNVSSDGLGDPFQGPGPDYELTVERGVAFNLLVHAFQTGEVVARGNNNDLFLNFTTESNPGSMDDLTIDVTLPGTRPSEPLSATGSVLLPATGELSETGTFVGFAFGAADSTAFAPLVGGSSPSGISADGTRGEYTMTYIQPAFVDSIRTIFRLSIGTRLTSFVIFDGAPPNGEQSLQFLAAPDVTTPEFGTVQSLYDEVRFRDAVDDVVLQIIVSRDVDGEPDTVGGWYISPGATAVTIPGAPAGFDTAAVLGTAEVSARVQHCDAFDGDVCQRLTNSRSFGLMP